MRPVKRPPARLLLEVLEDRLPVSTLLHFGPPPSFASRDLLQENAPPAQEGTQESEETTTAFPERSSSLPTDKEVKQTEVSRTSDFLGENRFPTNFESKPNPFSDEFPALTGGIGLALQTVPAAAAGHVFSGASHAPATPLAARPPHASGASIRSDFEQTIIPEYNSGGPDTTLAGDDKTSAKKPGGGGGSGGGTGFQSKIVGNAANANVNPTSGGLALLGGGIDVDAVFTWMGDKANGGDFVVLRATGKDGYNDYIADLNTQAGHPLDSVETLIIKSTSGANSDYVFNAISNAEAIFIAGGDQADYINLWKGTRVEDAIYAALNRNVPIGGTSAGLDILGEFDFTAQLGTISSAETLANPFDSRIIIDNGLLTPAEVSGTPLDLLQDTITDSHFEQRDRMGRLMTFMARMDEDGLAATPYGIGLNESSALLVEPDGTATVVGNVTGPHRAIYFLEGTTDPTVIDPNTPLTYTGVKVIRAEIGDTINLNTWTGTGLDTYFLSVSAGVLTSTQAGGFIY